MVTWKKRTTSHLELLEPLGEGLTSQVYKAIRKHADLGVEQIIAAKVLHSKKEVQTLKNEIDILMRIESLHCVRLLGWEDLERGPAILLEFLDGVSLIDLCAYETLAPQVIDEIIAQLQIGLSDLHRFGIKHGDLSAKNIFITNRGVVKILDFGFSGESTEVFGTPQFAAIEVWRGQATSQGSDLFSLGLLHSDLQKGTILNYQTRDFWRHRALEMIGKNSLLFEAPGDRKFLPLNSYNESKELLTLLVRQVQDKKRAIKNTTRILKETTCEPSQGRSFFWLKSAVFSGIFLFFNNPEPAIQSATAASMNSQRIEVQLDIRSRDWTEVKLFNKSAGGTQAIETPHFAPYKYEKLNPGNYELHWKSRGQTGIIFVQLNQSQRILIR